MPMPMPMPDAPYPSQITVEPRAASAAALDARVRVPGSKSLTNRALIVAALAQGSSTLTGALDCEDTRVMVDSLRKLGFVVEHDPATATIRVQGRAGAIPNREADLFVANSGTSLRFLTAMVSVGRGVYRLDGSPRMRQRPAADLLLALNRLGADARSDNASGCPPLTITASRLDGGFVDVRGDVSSQFLSGLLMALPYAIRPTSVQVEGPLVSRPYVEMTLAVMRSFGLNPSNRRDRLFNVQPGTYGGRPYAIEPDASAASYFFAAAAILGGSVTVEGLGSATPLQGDLAFIDLLEHMGCAIDRGATATTVRGPGAGGLRGVDVDMNAISDTVMTLAVVALFADGITRIRDVAHIRHKETDRIAALAAELRKLGADVTEHPDGLTIVPPPDGRLTPATIATYNDHRMAMAFAIAGLRAPGITIDDPGCVAKTYPGFWDDLQTLRDS
jgi:3-phosphoshikimate 1-carboxyvinyltransferase